MSTPSSTTGLAGSQSVRQHPHSYLLYLIMAGLIVLGLTIQIIFLQGTQKAHAASKGSVPYGLNLDINEQSLVDMIKNEPRFEQVNSTALTQDDNGWPTSDFQEVIDNRYTYAWINGATNIDPQKASTDISGTYKLSFTGQATLVSADGGDPSHAGTTITNQQYDAASNTTTADVTIPNPAGGALVVLQFTQTKRNPGDNAGTGVTNVRMIRPGYDASSTQVYTNLWLDSINNYKWQALRFMGVTGTNGYGDPATDGHPNSELYPKLLQWDTDRSLPDKGPLYGVTHPGVHGIPWEYVVLAAQQTHRDLWINVPVNASSDYVNKLAGLLKNGDSFTGSQGIPDDVNVYVEYSNEMWHYGFHQGPWNLQAAKDEVAAGGSNLNYDGKSDDDTIRFRRIAKKTVEIGQQFTQIFGSTGRIRPVINNAFTDHDTDMLNYIKANYGTVNQYLYAISQTGYYSSSDKSSVQAILNGEKAASDTNKTGYQTSRSIADQFGVHSLVYEGGQDEEGNKDPNTPVDTTLANQFGAARDAGMEDVEVHDLTNWYNSGGELYMQFAHVGRFSTYGMWGLSEDLTNQQTGKWKGAIDIMNNSAWSKPDATSANSVASANSVHDIDNRRYAA